MISMSKPPHKFFSRHLALDLDDLSKYLWEKTDFIYNNGIGAPEDVFKEKKERGDALTTMLGDYYNIFTWGHPALKELYQALLETTKEACEYYSIDFDSQDYYINGWFNTFEHAVYGGESPRNHPEWFHDHMKGVGAPVFHGYFCVNAEPSTTLYHINRDPNNLFENINKNNRLIISETGHPHAIENWGWNGKRLTIAYDISPKDVNGEKFVGNHWIPLR